MDPTIPIEQRHVLIRWLFLKWPEWIKFAAVAGTVIGFITGAMGFGGSIVNAIHARDEKLKAATIVEQQAAQRAKEIDTVLKQHGAKINATEAAVQEIKMQSVQTQTQIGELGRKFDAAESGRSEQLNRIESALSDMPRPKPQK